MKRFKGSSIISQPETPKKPEWLQRMTKGSSHPFSISGYAPSPTRDVHVLTPGTYDCVTLRSKRDFADGLQLRVLTWGDCLAFSRWATSKHMNP